MYLFLGGDIIVMGGRLVMTKRAVGLALTVVVTVALTWAMYVVMSGAPGCAESQATCPTSFGPGITILFLSVLVSFAAMALGAIECFAAMFVAIGLGALLAVPGLADVDRFFPLTFGSAFLVSGVAAAWFLFRLQSRGDVEKALVDHGRPAIGRILDVRDTGMTINDDPRVSVSVEITRADVTADSHTATKTITMDRVRPILVGDRYPVLIDPENPSEWGLVTAINDPSLVADDVRRLWEELRGPLPPPAARTH